MIAASKPGGGFQGGGQQMQPVGNRQQPQVVAQPGMYLNLIQSIPISVF